MAKENKKGAENLNPHNKIQKVKWNEDPHHNKLNMPLQKKKGENPNSMTI